jgi:hypothetical protein
MPRGLTARVYVLAEDITTLRPLPSGAHYAVALHAPGLEVQSAIADTADLAPLLFPSPACDRCGGPEPIVEWADAPERETGYLDRRALCLDCREAIDRERAR